MGKERETIKITEVESFRVEVPLTEQQQGAAGYYNSTGITRVLTDEGIIGYGFTECDAEEVAGILVGGDPLAVERYLEAGLDRWFGV